MKSAAMLEAKLVEIQNDQRLLYPPASTDTNLSLALAQLELKTKVATLKWVLDHLEHEQGPITGEAVDNEPMLVDGPDDICTNTKVSEQPVEYYVKTGYFPVKRNTLTIIAGEEVLAMDDGDHHLCSKRVKAGMVSYEDGRIYMRLDTKGLKDGVPILANYVYDGVG